MRSTSSNPNQTTWIRMGRTLSTQLSIAAAALSLAACGSSVTPRDGVTSLASTSTLPSGSLSTSGLAECVGFDSSTIRLQGRMTTYYWAGAFVDNKVRVRIQSLPADFAASSAAEISLYRWRIDSSTGFIVQDQTPVSFSIENLTGMPLTTADQTSRATFTSLPASLVPTLRTRNNLTGSTLLDFLNMTSLIAEVGTNFQVLQIVLNSRVNTNEVNRVGHTDVLIPAFTANPNTYRANRPTLLAGLHPFDAIRSLGLTDAEWVSRSRSSCF